MRKIKLFTTTEKLIYEGHHPSFVSAIEFALTYNVPLDDVDLSFADLRHINLDGVTLNNANFAGADLTGANMSEARFLSCNFSGAKLIDACLCYTDINNCNFKYTAFGATDISMAIIDSCAFEGWNTFDLDFSSAFSLYHLVYMHHAIPCPFSFPPTVIQAKNHHIAILGKNLINRDTPHTFEYKNYRKLFKNQPPLDEQPIVDIIKKYNGNS